MKSLDLSFAGRLTLGCSLLVAALLSGCADSPPWGAWSQEPSSQQISAALGRPQTFIYFTQYEVYRREARREYVYRESGAWVHRDQPPATVSESALRASPSVKLALTDTPERRHEAVKRAYPRDWGMASAVMAAMP